MPILPSLPAPRVYIETYQNYVSMSRVELESLTEGLDDTPTVLRLSLPPNSEILSLAPGAMDPTDLLQNTRVIVTIDGRYLFCGRIRMVHRKGSGTDRSVGAVAYDARHTLSGRVIGQYGIGELATVGGWSGVGYTPEFNPGGAPNRTLYDPAVNPATGIRFPFVYRFARPSTAADPAPTAYWTNADVLRWLLNWYTDETLILTDPDLFDTIPALDKRCTLGEIGQIPVGRAITSLLRSVGMRWTLRYDNRASNLYGIDPPVGVFTILGADVSAPFSRSLHIERPIATATPSGEPVLPGLIPGTLGVSEWQTADNTLESADRTEVHADPDIYQTTWTGGETPATDFLKPVNSDNPDFAYCWVPYIWALHYDSVFNSCLVPDPWSAPGAAPPSSTADTIAACTTCNTIPFRWLRKLLPMAGNAAADIPDWEEASAPKATDNIWIKSPADYIFDWTRIKSGARVDFDDCRIYLKNRVALYATTAGATEDEDEAEHELTVAPQIRFTVASVTTIHRGRKTLDEGIYGPFPMTRLIRRRRLAATYCRNAYVHTAASATRSEGTLLNPAATLDGIPDCIHDISTELADILTYILAAEAVSKVRHSGSFTIPHACRYADLPHIGDAITFHAFNPGMPATGCRIVAVNFDLQTLEHRLGVADAFL